MKRIFLFLVVTVVFYGCSDKKTALEIGDIIFQTSQTNEGKFIETLTESTYSHIGVLVKKDKKWYVFEAEQKIQYTPIEEWVKRGLETHYIVKRLEDRKKYFTDTKEQEFIELCDDLLSKNVDKKYLWSDGEFYAAELVWKLYEKVLGIKAGKVKKISDYAIEDTKIKNEIKKRYQGGVPLNEDMVMPIDIFNWTKLETIINHYGVEVHSIY